MWNFFVLSGFIIAYVTLSPLSLKSRMGTREYAAKRFSRIVPFLWVAVVGYGVLRYLGAGELDLWSSIRAFILWPVGQLRPNVVWSLRHEALFYSVFAVAFLLRQRQIYFLVSWCSLPVIIWVCGQVGFQVPGGELLDFVASPVNVEFGVGVAMGCVYQRLDLSRRRLESHVVVSWVLVVLACLGAFAVRDEWGFVGTVPACALAVSAGLLAPTSTSWFARVWAILGDASYAGLFDRQHVYSCRRYVWIGLVGGSPVAAFGALAPFAVVGGVLCHFWIERPTIRFARGIASRRRSRRAAAGANSLDA